MSELLPPRGEDGRGPLLLLRALLLISGALTLIG